MHSGRGSYRFLYLFDFHTSVVSFVYEYIQDCSVEMVTFINLFLDVVSSLTFSSDYCFIYFPLFNVCNYMLVISFDFLIVVQQPNDINNQQIIEQQAGKL